MFKLILKYHLKSLYRYYAVRSFAKLMTAFLFLLLFFGVGSGIYLFFREGLSYFNADQYFGQALLYYVFEMYLLVFMFLVLMSTLITGLFRLFKGGNDDWLMASPGFFLLPQSVWLTSIWHASWPFMVIVIPLLAAVKQAFGMGLPSTFLILLSACLLTVVLATAGLLVLLCSGFLLYMLNRLWPAIRLNSRSLALALILFVLVITGLSWQTAINNDLIKMFQAEELVRTAAGVGLIAENFSWSPSHILAAAMLAWQRGNTAALLSYHGLLWLYAGGLAAAWWLVSKSILPLWGAFQQGARPVESRAGAKGRRVRASARFKGGPLRALFKNEGLQFLRNTRGLLWFGFLLFIWLVQAGVNVVLSRNVANYELELISVPDAILVMQFLTAIYFVAAFVLRFVFPAFSSEKKSAWVLASAPLDWRRIYFAKLVFYNILLMVLGVLIAYVNLSALNLAWTALGSWLLLFLAVICLMVTFGLSLGAVFRSYDTDDPSALGTSLPGLIFVFGSLAYGAVGGLAAYLLLAFQNNTLLVSYVATTLLMLALMIIFTPRQLKRMDVVRSVIRS